VATGVAVGVDVGTGVGLPIAIALAGRRRAPSNTAHSARIRGEDVKTARKPSIISNSSKYNMS
jgi:hypothetical protein